MLLAAAAIIPLVIFNYYNNLSFGIAMALGALISSPSDVPGSFRRRVIGIFLSILLAVFATLVASYAAGNLLVFIPVIAFLLFGLSIISVYGFRASLISFSGLFAVVLSMAKISSEVSVVLHALLIGAGGMGYLSLAVLTYYINPKRQTEGLLAEVFELTADYLKIRAELLKADLKGQENLKNKLQNLQTSLNEKHELIREMVISRRRSSGRSGAAQKKLLIFMEMVDILELAMANPVNYERMAELFSGNREKLEVLTDWNLQMSQQLKEMGMFLAFNKKLSPNPKLHTFIEKATKVIREFEEENSDKLETVLVFSGLVHFREKQYQKIVSIERLLRDLDSKRVLSLKKKDAVKFIPGQEYDIKTLQNNLDFKSPIFRHSLRLTVILLVGYVIGNLLHLQNAYWILLTSLVIMRPGYALTKERFKQRLYGTLIGGALAASIVLLTQNAILYGIFAVVTLVLAFSMIQKNYKAAAAFITLNIVFVYSLLNPNAFEVIQFRLLDTFIGAGLAFLGNAFLWPTWEYKGIKNFIVESISADKEYLKEIEILYQQKDNSATSYKLARKEAFLAIGNLNAAFQRMTQEPKSRQVEFQSIYEIVTLNQELLSSITSLGAFVRTHSTTEPSIHFKAYISTIQGNLSNAIHNLNKEPVEDSGDAEKVLEAQIYFKEKIEDLVATKNREEGIGEMHGKSDKGSIIQEVQVVMDQLKWLLEISKNINSLVLKNKWQ